MSEITIEVINESSTYLKDVIALGDANKQTLGFLSDVVFFEQAKKVGILVAINQEQQCVGYLMYRFVQRHRHIRIIHLCIDNQYRGLGIARRLNNRLIEETKNIAYGIGLFCREDYSVNKMWPRLGYVATFEKPGRKKSGSILINWWLDYHHPGLFDAKKEDLSLNLRVAVDAQIFYALSSSGDSIYYLGLSDTARHEISLLELDWLNQEVTLGITEEIFNEISRDFKTKKEKDEKRLAISKFDMLKPATQGSTEILDNLEKTLSLKVHESSIRHIARCANAGVSIFLTLDQDLLEFKDIIRKIAGVLVLSPSQLIIQLDDVSREVAYQPVYLAGLEFKSQVLSEVSDLSILSKIFITSESNESEKEFRQYLNSCVQGIKQSQLITHNKKPLILNIFETSQSQEVIIRYLRSTQNGYASTVLRHILFESATKAIKEGIAITKVVDPYISDDVKAALRDSNFVYLADRSEWIRVHCQYSANLQEVSRKLSDLSKKHESYTLMPILLNKISHPNFLHDSISISDVEKLLWPLKILDAEQPSFIIPINPEWAKELFDKELASQTLFGSLQPEVFLNTESVYYRSRLANGGLQPNTYGRILWYVSQGKKNGYTSTQAIRACSQIDEILIDYPQNLYNRFSRLGVYKLDQLVKLSSKDDGLNSKIMAIKFSNTELFKNSISLSQARIILQKKSSFQSPCKISPSQFSRFYKQGMALIDD